MRSRVWFEEKLPKALPELCRYGTPVTNRHSLAIPNSSKKHGNLLPNQIYSEAYSGKEALFRHLAQAMHYVLTTRFEAMAAL